MNSKQLMKRMKQGPAIIVAEISANHDNSFKRAVTLIKKAKECGADAVKFQVFTPDTLTINAGNKYFRLQHPKWGGQTLYQLYGKAYMPWRWLKELKKIADELGILFFATAFDKSSIDFLEEMNVPLHKIASFEFNDLPLIAHAAKTRKPLILSTGMATKMEIKEAMETVKKTGAKDIILLKCVSSYPADPSDMNLRTIPDMRQHFKCPVGLSDHTLGIAAAIGAVTLGACLIEKHFVLTRKRETLDSFFSIEPEELQLLVDNVRIVAKALGGVRYGLTSREKNSCIFRRSLFAVEDIKKGELFTETNVRSIRPGYGLPPKNITKVLGKRSVRNIKRGNPIQWDHINL